MSSSSLSSNPLSSCDLTNMTFSFFSAAPSRELSRVKSSKRPSVQFKFPDTSELSPFRAGLALSQTGCHLPPWTRKSSLLPGGKLPGKRQKSKCGVTFAPLGRTGSEQYLAYPGPGIHHGATPGWRAGRIPGASN